MYRLRHLNLDQAVDRFVSQVETLTRLPFMTDAEMLLVYGEEVVESAGVLSLYNRDTRVCLDCAKRCCLTVHCELYDAGFSRCPVFEYRPAICRMHFCEKFTIGDRSFISEFADVYLNSLLEAKLQGSRKVDFFDSPPFSRYAPEFIAAISPFLDAFRKGLSEESETIKLIQAEADRFRTSQTTLNRIGNIDKSTELFLAETRYWLQGR